MICLSRSMMERYEIRDTRPGKASALRFGADRLMLSLADRVPGGAICVTGSAEALNEQDCMYTLITRSEDSTGQVQRSEHVVQSILRAVKSGDPELEAIAADESITCFYCHAESDDRELALTARLLRVRAEKGIEPPYVILLSELPAKGTSDAWREAVLRLEGIELPAERFVCVLSDGFCAPLSESERAREEAKMNYSDTLAAWSEPGFVYTWEKSVPGIAEGGDFEAACEAKARILDTAMLMCVCGGWLSGLDTTAQVMADEKLRAWIGHAFYDELFPLAKNEAWKEYAIRAFGRLENTANDARLLDLGRAMLSRADRTLLASLRAYANENFESPKLLSLGLSAAIMLYAGIRMDERGLWCVSRGKISEPVAEDPEILEAFSRLSHDMPAEALAYAALADRSIWGCDLRDIDGLELRVALDLSSIQRIGFRETVRLRLEDAQ